LYSHNFLGTVEVQLQLKLKKKSFVLQLSELREPKNNGEVISSFPVFKICLFHKREKKILIDKKVIKKFKK